VHGRLYVGLLLYCPGIELSSRNKAFTLYVLKNIVSASEWIGFTCFRAVLKLLIEWHAAIVVRIYVYYFLNRITIRIIIATADVGYC